MINFDPFKLCFSGQCSSFQSFYRRIIPVVHFQYVSPHFLCSGPEKVWHIHTLLEDILKRGTIHYSVTTGVPVTPKMYLDNVDLDVLGIWPRPTVDAFNIKKIPNNNKK